MPRSTTPHSNYKFDVTKFVHLVVPHGVLISDRHAHLMANRFINDVRKELATLHKKTTRFWKEALGSKKYFNKATKALPKMLGPYYAAEMKNKNILTFMSLTASFDPSDTQLVLKAYSINKKDSQQHMDGDAVVLAIEAHALARWIQRVFSKNMTDSPKDIITPSLIVGLMTAISFELMDYCDTNDTVPNQIGECMVRTKLGDFIWKDGVLVTCLPPKFPDMENMIIEPKE